MGLARCWTVFPVSAVVGAVVPAAVCRWGLCPCCSDVGRGLSGIRNHHYTSMGDAIASSCGLSQVNMHRKCSSV